MGVTKRLLVGTFLVGATLLQADMASLYKAEEATVLRADQVSREEHFDLITARGNVEIIHGNEVLLADLVTYNESAGTVTATGNVRFKSKDGDVIFANYLEVTSDFKEGVSRHIRMIMRDGAKLAAKDAKREGGVRSAFDMAVYSPCEVCRTKPDKAPLWQIEAKRTLLDDESQDVIYTDAVMRMWDVPVMYLPYFRHPAPHAGRRSGLLAPTFASSSGSSGSFVALPYYWVINDQRDMTITPMYADTRPALGLSYRERFARGFLRLAGSGLFGADKKKSAVSDSDKALEKSFRGHIVGSMQFHLNPYWRVGAQIERASDQTYLRRLPYFGFEKSTNLVSRIYAEYFNRLDYFSIEGYTFQGLRDGDRNATTPLLLPMVEYSALTRPGKWGEVWTLDASALGLTRREGTDMGRMSATGGVYMPYYSSFGEVYTFGARVRGDVYHARHLTTSMLSQSTTSGTTGRFFPQGYAHWRLPLVDFGSKFNTLLEPRVGLFVAPNTAQGDKVPNEDSRFPEFNTYNLFSSSRFAGLDRLDTGSRMVYGLGGQTSALGDNAQIDAFMGQSVGLSEPRDFLRYTGLDHRWSHYVGRLSGSYQDWLTLETRLLMNRVHLRPERHEFLASLGKPILRLNADYMKLPVFEEGVDGYARRKQLTLGLSSQLTPQWSVDVSSTRQLGSPSFSLAHGAGVKYQDECFGVQARVERTFYKDRDVKPGLTVLLLVTFKNLGEIKHELNPRSSSGTTPF